MNAKRNLRIILDSHNESGYDSAFHESFDESLHDSSHRLPSSHSYPDTLDDSLLDESPPSRRSSISRSPARDVMKQIFHRARVSPKLSPAEKKLISEDGKPETPLSTKKSDPRRLLFASNSPGKNENRFMSVSSLSPKKMAAKFNHISGRAKSQLFSLPLVCSPQKNNRKALVELSISEEFQNTCIEKPGSKIGAKTLDLLAELLLLDMPVDILSYLPTRDLDSASLACKKWNRLLQLELESRRKAALAEKSPNNSSPENINKSRCVRNLRDLRSEKNPKSEKDPSILRVHDQNRVDETAQTVECRAKCSDSLVDLRATSEQKVVPCPSCTKRALVYPVKDEGVCQNPSCGFRFCSLCDNPYHGSNPCRTGPAMSDEKRPLKKASICSKKSKSMLRRL